MYFCWTTDGRESRIEAGSGGDRIGRLCICPAADPVGRTEVMEGGSELAEDGATEE